MYILYYIYLSIYLVTLNYNWLTYLYILYNGVIWIMLILPLVSNSSCVSKLLGTFPSTPIIIIIIITYSFGVFHISVS